MPAFFFYGQFGMPGTRALASAPDDIAGPADPTVPALPVPIAAGEPIALSAPPAPVPMPEVPGPPAGSEPVTGRAELVVTSQHCPLISLDLPAPVCPAARAVVPSNKAAAREIAFMAFPFLGGRLPAGRKRPIETPRSRPRRAGALPRALHKKFSNTP
jgi:hypothetical protein